MPDIQTLNGKDTMEINIGISNEHRRLTGKKNQDKENTHNILHLAHSHPQISMTMSLC